MKTPGGEIAMDMGRIEAAVDRCFDAALSGDDWSVALHDLSRAANAAGAMFLPQVPDRSILDLPASLDYHDYLKLYVKNRWWEHNHRARFWDICRLRSEVVVTEDDLSTPQQRMHLYSYNEHYLRHGFYGFAAAGFRVEGKVWAVSFQRYQSQGHFDRRDATVLGSLIPQLRRMITISNRISSDAANARLDALDRIRLPAVTLDRTGSVVGENPAFAAMTGDTIRILARRIVVDDRPSAASLDALIQSLLTANGKLAAQETDFAVIRRAGRRPIVVEGYAVSTRYPDFRGGVHALLVFRDLDAGPPDVRRRLTAAFGLTAAEARVASELAGGATPEQIAEKLGISLGTVRVQLKSIYGKMDVGRQADVVRIVSRL
jgi:DNA-binding CsgD family transcriptional regulator